jgi:class 3 adenylate cyclase
VNIASRVQGLAQTRSILATAAVINNPKSAEVLSNDGQKLLAQSHPLRGVAAEMAVYEIP